MLSKLMPALTLKEGGLTASGSEHTPRRGNSEGRHRITRDKTAEDGESTPHLPGIQAGEWRNWDKGGSSQITSDQYTKLGCFNSVL